MTERPPAASQELGPTDQDLREAIPRERGGREVRIGLFVLLGLLSFLVLLYLLTDPATFRGRYNITTDVADASGLRSGDPVRMRGVGIGRVRDFVLRDGEVLITLEIEGEWKIPEDSRTRLSATDLLGGRVVQVVPGEAEDPVDPGGHIPGEGGMEGAESLTTQAADVLERVQRVLSEPTIEDVRGSVEELESLLSTLSSLTASQSREVARLTASLNRSALDLEEVAGSAAQGAPDLVSAAARADSALLVMNRTSVRLDAAARSLETLMGQLEEGEGTLGQLMTNEELYDNLSRAAASIADLADDLRENPKRYLNISIF